MGELSRRSPFVWVVLVAVLLTLVGGCAGSLTEWGTISEHDAGPADGGADADAGSDDAGTDAGPGDAGPVDGGATDAGDDAGLVDAGEDAGWDAGPPDAGCFERGLTDCGGTCVNLAVSMGNCGGCGTVCEATAPSLAECSGGRCYVNLAPNRHTPEAIALDLHYVYWADNDARGNNVAARVPLNGGTPETLVTGLDRPPNIAVDDNNLYWTDFFQRKVMKKSLSGGSPQTLALLNDYAHGIATDGTWVYFTGVDTGLIAKVPVEGGAIVTLSYGYGAPAMALTLVDNSLIWGANKVNGEVYFLSLETGTRQLIATNQSKVAATTMDQNNFYWSEDWGASVKKKSRDSGIVTTLASGRQNPVSLAIDNAWVYWVEWQGVNNVIKVPIEGGEPVTLATDQPLNLDQILVDSTSAYWSTGTCVMKVTPK